MGKLVRDRVPEMMRRSGKEPDVRVLSIGEFRDALRAKFAEEAAELRAAPEADVIGELSDLLELVEATADAYGFTLADVAAAAAAKRDERGGFAQRYWVR
jgi:predicted house-cleaning noncanonical NTP pyrophosphatase (MazG superfamily)